MGGDFFQIIPLEDKSTIIVLGDVSGKGLKAAMAVSLIVGAVRALADDYPGPAQLLTQLNRRLCGRLQGGFATCVILRLNPGRECTSPAQDTQRPSSTIRELVLAGALPLGPSPTAVYDETTSLQVGDHCSLYTDGLLEARNPTESSTACALATSSPRDLTPNKPRKPPSPSARTMTSLSSPWPALRCSSVAVA